MEYRKLVKDCLDKIRLSNESESPVDVLKLQRQIITDDQLFVSEKGFLLLETHNHKWGTELTNEIADVGFEFEQPGYGTLSQSYEHLWEAEKLLGSAKREESSGYMKRAELETKK